MQDAMAHGNPTVPPAKEERRVSRRKLLTDASVAGLGLAGAALGGAFAYDKLTGEPAERTTGLLRENVATTFNPTVDAPVIAEGAYIDRFASVIGNVIIADQVYVAPFASIRGDEGQPLVISEGTNVQDGVVLHALETFADGKVVEKNLVTVGGKKYAVHIGKHVSLAHQSQVHGPAAVGDYSFIGMQALVFKATVGKNVVVEPAAKLIGVTVPEGRYVPAGMVLTKQSDADKLPAITPDYAFATLNKGVLHVNEQLCTGYLAVASGKPAAGGAHGATASTTKPATSAKAATTAKEPAAKPAAAETKPAAAGH